MSTCSKCRHQSTWQEVFIQTFTINRYFHCPNCGTKQLLSKTFHRKSNGIFFLMLIIILGGNFLLGPSVFALIALFLSAAAYFFAYPYFITFENE